jgi:hypothetical protein
MLGNGVALLAPDGLCVNAGELAIEELLDGDDDADAGLLALAPIEHEFLALQGRQEVAGGGLDVAALLVRQADVGLGKKSKRASSSSDSRIRAHSHGSLGLMQNEKGTYDAVSS